MDGVSSTVIGRGGATAAGAIVGGGSTVVVVYGKDPSSSEDSESESWTTQNCTPGGVFHRTIMRIVLSMVTLSGCMCPYRPLMGVRTWP